MGAFSANFVRLVPNAFFLTSLTLGDEKKKERRKSAKTSTSKASTSKSSVPKSVPPKTSTPKPAVPSKAKESVTEPVASPVLPSPPAAKFEIKALVKAAAIRSTGKDPGRSRGSKVADKMSKVQAFGSHSATHKQGIVRKCNNFFHFVLDFLY